MNLMNQNTYNSIKIGLKSLVSILQSLSNQSFSYFLKPAVPLKWYIIMQKIEFCRILRKRMQKLAIDKGKGQGLPAGKKGCREFFSRSTAIWGGIIFQWMELICGSWVVQQPWFLPTIFQQWLKVSVTTNTTPDISRCLLEGPTDPGW